jgi:hypothetical protein
MPAARCPHCQSVLEVRPEQRGQEVVCGHCGQRTLMPAAPTEIQTAETHVGPLPAELGMPLPSLEAIKNPETDLAAIRPVRLSWKNLLAESATLRRELDRFGDDALPNLRGMSAHMSAQPIPGELPEEADELGAPLASIHLPGEWRKTSIGTVCALLLGTLSICCVPVILDGPGSRGVFEAIPAVLLYAIPFAALAIWLAFFRKWTPNRALWVCPGGILWQWGERAGFRRWHEIEDFSASGATGRPLFWITPAEGTDFVLSAGQGPTVTPIADYIELKASAALLPIALKRIADGEKVEFGKLAMDRRGIHFGAGFCTWRNFDRIWVNGTTTSVDDVNRRGRFQLKTRDVSFPMVAQSVARIVSEEGLPA